MRDVIESMVEPLYCGHSWDNTILSRGVLNSGVYFYVAGTVESVLIKGDVRYKEFHCN